MNKCIAFLLLCMVCVTGFSQTVKRWPNGRVEMTDKRMSYEARTNIFDEYSWTYPDIKSRQVNFVDDRAQVDIGGQSYKLTMAGSAMLLSSKGQGIESNVAKTNGKMYYSKSDLKLKAVTEQRWTSYTVYTSKSVPVQRSRSVTRYVYINGRSTPQYSTQYYTAYETRSVSETKWHYVPYTHYVIDIPVYDYYSFKVNDNLNVLVYKNEAGKYFVQNSAFVSAADAAGINHVLIDADCDGSFEGDADKVMFNSWNPYSPTSTYRSAGAYRDNKWYNLSELQHDNFLTFKVNKETRQMEISYENTKYVDEDDKGKVMFSNIPDDARLFINGRQYRARKSAAKFKSQYGKFLVRITQKGFTDFEKIYTISPEQPEVSVAYEPTQPAGTVRITNIFEQGYSVTVTNASGYERTYNNETNFSVPAGKNNIAIYSSGFTMSYDADVTAGGDVNIDFEQEIKKLKAADETEKPADNTTTPATTTPADNTAPEKEHE